MYKQGRYFTLGIEVCIHYCEYSVCVCIYYIVEHWCFGAL
jgi:hypothetical protein